MNEIDKLKEQNKKLHSELFKKNRALMSIQKKNTKFSSKILISPLKFLTLVGVDDFSGSQVESYDFYKGRGEIPTVTFSNEDVNTFSGVEMAIAALIETLPSIEVVMVIE